MHVFGSTNNTVWLVKCTKLDIGSMYACIALGRSTIAALLHVKLKLILSYRCGAERVEDHVNNRLLMTSTWWIFASGLTLCVELVLDF